MSKRIYRHPRTWPLDPETGQITGGPRSRLVRGAAAMKVVRRGRPSSSAFTRLVWIGTAQDVGKALNPQAVYGQIEGGTAQGIGLGPDGGDPDARAG